MTSIGSTLKPTSGTPPARATVLFADDEAVLREIASEALERAGYTALIAATADDAAALLEAHPDAALAVLDWNMPGASGAALVARVLTTHPGLVVVISSGDIDDEVRAVQARYVSVHVLQKPWRVRALLGLIASLLA